MFGRGLTGVVWLIGLAAMTYEDVVIPLAHQAFGVGVTVEQEAEPEADQARRDSFAARAAPPLAKGPTWRMHEPCDEVARSRGTRGAARSMTARIGAEAEHGAADARQRAPLLLIPAPPRTAPHPAA